MINAQQVIRYSAAHDHADASGNSWRPYWRLLVVVGLMALCATSVQSQGTGATRPRETPPVGTLGPGAAAALGDPWKASTQRPDVRQGDSRGMGRRIRGGVVPLRVIDAPLATRGGGALVVYPQDTPAPFVPPAAQWYPTMQPPRWHVVEEEHPVQAWRVVEVEDLLCNALGTCTIVTSRILARWAPALRNYAFADRVGRVWIVE